MTLQDFLTKYDISDLSGLVSCIKTYGKQLPVDCVYQAAEFLNPNRDLTAAFYTDTAICKKIMAELPDFTEKDHIRILEPSVGAGNFLPFIAEKYKTKRILELYLIDIDDNELRIAELIFETFFRDKYSNVAIIYINDDYLKFPVAGKKFDLVIGNPPYAKIKDYNLQREYRKNSKITKSSNLFVWFLEKAYEHLKETFFNFTVANTDIGSRGSSGRLECGRIFTKVINVLAFELNKRGTERGHISQHVVTYDMLMYNRDNFRDIYAEKPKSISRKDYMAQHHIVINEAYFRYMSSKAKRRLRTYNNQYRNGLSEMPGDTEKATHIHHIFSASEFPEISFYLENLIALTPNQHLNTAHPNGKTILIDRSYQHDCLIVKADIGILH